METIVENFLVPINRDSIASLDMNTRRVLGYPEGLFSSEGDPLPCVGQVKEGRGVGCFGELL